MKVLSTTTLCLSLLASIRGDATVGKANLSALSRRLTHLLGTRPHNSLQSKREDYTATKEREKTQKRIKLQYRVTDNSGCLVRSCFVPTAPHSTTPVAQGTVSGNTPTRHVQSCRPDLTLEITSSKILLLLVYANIPSVISPIPFPTSSFLGAHVQQGLGVSACLSVCLCVCLNYYRH